MPYSKKSYQSTTAPTKLLRAALRARCSEESEGVTEEEAEDMRERCSMNDSRDVLQYSD